MPGEENIKFTITTTADTEGADKVKASVDDVNQSLTATGQIAQQSGAAVNVAFQEVANTFQGLENVQGDVAKSAEKFSQSGAEGAKEYKDQVVTLLEELINLNKEQKKVVSESKKLSDANKQDTESMLGSLKKLKDGWRAVATAVSGVFGALGLVERVISTLQAAWAWLNKDRIAAEKKYQDELERSKTLLEEMESALRKASAVKLLESYQYLDQARMEEDIRLINEKTDALNKQIDAQQRKDEEDRHRRMEELNRQELTLNQDLFKGNISKTDASVRQQEINQERAQISREGNYGNLDATIAKLDNTIKGLDSQIKRNSEEIAQRENAVMNVQEVDTSFKNLKQAEQYISYFQEQIRKAGDEKTNQETVAKIGGTLYRDAPIIEQEYQEKVAQASKKLEELNAWRDKERQYIETQVERVAPGLDSAFPKSFEKGTDENQVKEYEKQVSEFQAALATATKGFSDVTANLIKSNDNLRDLADKMTGDATELEEQAKSERRKGEETGKTENLQTHYIKEQAAITAEIEKQRQEEARLKQELAETSTAADKAQTSLKAAKEMILELANAADAQSGGDKAVRELTGKIRDAASSETLTKETEASLTETLKKLEGQQTARQGRDEAVNRLVSLVSMTLDTFASSADALAQANAKISTLEARLRKIDSTVQTLLSQQANK